MDAISGRLFPLIRKRSGFEGCDSLGHLFAVDEDILAGIVLWSVFVWVGDFFVDDFKEFLIDVTIVCMTFAFG